MFQSTIGEAEDRLCSKCGSNPSLGVEAAVPESENPEGNPAATEAPTAAGKQRSPVRKRRRSYVMLKILGSWLLLLVFLVFATKWFFNDLPETRTPATTGQPEEKASAEDIALKQEAANPCNQTFANFIAATTPEGHNQFVIDPIQTAARMSRFYSLNPMANIDPSGLTLRDLGVVHLPGQRAVETYWTLMDGRTLDAVFIKQNDEWLLDWEHFVRFSDYPWALFLAGSGDSEGEFRLLARERLADERKGTNTISMVLYAPRFGHANETGPQSPEFLVKRDSSNGKLLEKAFALERSGKRVFDVQLPSINPEGLIRVRVKVRRHDETTGRSFELVDVVACHWYSSNNPGLVISDQPPAK